MTTDLPTTSEAAAVAQIARHGMRPVWAETSDETAFVLLVPAEHGAVNVVDMQAYAEQPRASHRRNIEVYTPQSLITYVRRHGTERATRIVHDPLKHTVTAIIDDTAWAAHTCTLTLRLTPDWMAWQQLSGQPLPQDTFAEFVEDHLHQFVVPDGATMLEIAQTFHAAESARFVSGTRLSTGETRLVYEQDITAKAGSSGALNVPSTVTLALEPFAGSGQFEIRARFRFRLSGGKLTLSFVLDQPAEVTRAAFADMSTLIEEDLEEFLHSSGCVS